MSLGFHGDNADPNTEPFVWISTLPFSVFSPRLAALPGAVGVRVTFGAHTMGRGNVPVSCMPLKLGGIFFIRGCSGAFCQRWVYFARSLSPNSARMVIAAVLPQLPQGFTGPVLSGKHMFC